jgi:hypothetical protein
LRKQIQQFIIYAVDIRPQGEQFIGHLSTLHGVS